MAGPSQLERYTERDKTRFDHQWEIRHRRDLLKPGIHGNPEPRPGRHFRMGRKPAGQLAPAGSEWERRKAEQAERAAAAMEDPVSRFHRRHGRPVRRRLPTAEDVGEAQGEDAGPA